MTNRAVTAIQYAEEQRERFLEELKDYVRIPSISTDPQAKPDMQRAAEWTADQLRSLGMEQVQILPTGGHPVVYGEWMGAGTDQPTVLIYGHYDVQPVEPIELWQTPPFEPTLRGDHLYGRGASDMKGQVIICLKAIEALVRTGGLRVNLKFLIEGEEEVGSPNLDAFIARHKDLLTSDFALNADTGMLGKDVPSITYGLRGLAYFEIRLSGPDRDLHSGLYGGVVHNPAQVLCELIAGMHDDQGRVTLPGFYDTVRPLDEQERAELARLGLDDAYFKAQTGVSQLWGEAKYSPVERIGARPTLEVNGLLSGFTGEGTKTVLPAKAMAKVSMRLVPDQMPEEVEQQLRRYLEQNAPEAVRWEVRKLSGNRASLTDINHPAVTALSKAFETVYNKRPVFKREGGSVAVVGQMQDFLGIPSVLTGFGLPDDNLHAPNEKIDVPNFYRGIRTLIHFFDNLVPAES